VAADLTKAMVSMSWALPLFGARQMARLFGAPPAVGPQPVGAECYAVSHAAQEQLGDIVWAAFQAGDELQRDAVDVAFDVLTLRAFAPAYLARAASAVAEQSRETGAVLAPGTASSRLAWRELRNKYEVYNLVKRVRALLGVPAGGAFPLLELVDRAYALGPYQDLWAVEGLGHDYAMARWRPGQAVRGLLTEGAARDLPDKSLTMMHAGIGLAFAEQLLKALSPYSPAAERRRVVAEFLALCRENSRDGYAGAAYESLGLVARTWHPELVPGLDLALREAAPDVNGYLWHGAGRALYFLPVHFVPGSPSPWRAAERSAPHELARRNLIAGVTWATTLVNMRHPAILERVIETRGARLARDDAFSSGVVSALVVGLDITPDDPHVAAFCRHRPGSADRVLADRWRTLVSGPCADVASRIQPELKRSRRLGEVFRYQPLAELG
jgi:hypothetical protein